MEMEAAAEMVKAGRADVERYIDAKHAQGDSAAGSLNDFLSVAHGRSVRADLSGEDLSLADWHGADFSNTNLSRVRFERADLSDANFTGAILSDAQAPYAVLRGTILHDTDLTGFSATHAVIDGLERDASRVRFHFDDVVDAARRRSEGEVGVGTLISEQDEQEAAQKLRSGGVQQRLGWEDRMQLQQAAASIGRA